MPYLIFVSSINRMVAFYDGKMLDWRNDGVKVSKY